MRVDESSVLRNWIAPGGSLIGAVLLLIALVSFVVGGARSASVTALSEKQADAAERMAETALPASVTVELDTTPSGAAVKVEGVHRGVTPLKLTFPRSEAPIAVEFEMLGHATRTEAITPNATQRLGFTLEADRPPPAPKFTPAPAKPKKRAPSAAKKTPAKPPDGLFE